MKQTQHVDPYTVVVDNDDVEEWRPITVEGYETLYSVSSHGRWRRESSNKRALDRKGTPTTRFFARKVLSNGSEKQKAHPDYAAMYPCRLVDRQGRVVKKKLRKMIADAFLPAPVCPPGVKKMMLVPIDGDQSNLRPDNMKYVPHGTQWKAGNKFVYYITSPQGIEYRFTSIADFGKEHGITKHTLIEILNRSRTKAGRNSCGWWCSASQIRRGWLESTFNPVRRLRRGRNGSRRKTTIVTLKELRDFHAKPRIKSS